MPQQQCNALVTVATTVIHRRGPEMRSNTRDFGMSRRVSNQSADVTRSGERKYCRYSSGSVWSFADSAESSTVCRVDFSRALDCTPAGRGGDSAPEAADSTASASSFEILFSLSVPPAASLAGPCHRAQRRCNDGPAAAAAHRPSANPLVRRTGGEREGCLLSRCCGSKRQTGCNFLGRADGKPSGVASMSL